jgi:hypothetical protein
VSAAALAPPLGLANLPPVDPYRTHLNLPIPFQRALSRSGRALAALALSLGAAGCASMAEPQGESSETPPPQPEVRAVNAAAVPVETFEVLADRLAAVQPADVFVAPPVDESGAFQAPLAALRQAYYRGLVERLYTPLQLPFGDALLAEGSGTPAQRALSRPELGADAVVELRLLRWDTQSLESKGRIVADVELTWMAPGSPEPLYMARRVRLIELSGRQVRNSARADLEQRAAETLARDLLERLPPRQAVAAPAR